MKKEIEVVGAALVKGGKVLALRRKNGIDSVVHKYEFVGGKVECGETHAEALKRECGEELSLQISVGEKIATVRHEYPEFIVNLSVYLCKTLSSYTLKEHEEERWLSVSELNPDDWAPADAEILCILKNRFKH